ncbi:MAG: hypothetical protein ACRETW_03705 [Stenotrophobium sp.]
MNDEHESQRAYAADHDHAEWRRRMEHDVRDLRTQLEENTALTKEVRDLMDAIRTGMRAMNWLGNAAKWLLGLGASLAVIWGALHGGKAP